MNVIRPKEQQFLILLLCRNSWAFSLTFSFKDHVCKIQTLLNPISFFPDAKEEVVCLNYINLILTTPKFDVEFGLNNSLEIVSNVSHLLISLVKHSKEHIIFH